MNEWYRIALKNMTRQSIRKTIIVLALQIFSCVLYAQQPPKEYAQLIRQADSLYQGRDYKTSAHTYSLAFKLLGWKGYPADRYNASCSWALASVPDSAFQNLERIVLKTNYSNYRHITSDKDLISLHSDPRWKPLIEKVKENKDRLEINFDKSLIHLLDSLVTEDQKWRNYHVQADNGKLPEGIPTREHLANFMRKTDSLNYFIINRIFKKHGFPNYDLVGENGSNNFWLLIQHQDNHPEFQQEVLARMKVEADKGKASLINYAYLTDRVNVNTGQLQVYGTQMKLNASQTSFEPQPVIEPEKLNERRKSIGLESIESYINLMNSRYHGVLKKK